MAAVNMVPPASYRTSPASSDADPRRSTSSRSTLPLASAGYVSLLRKQKATVWCDRSQLEDTRVQAKLQAAKQRAAHEISGSVRSSTGGSASLVASGSSGSGLKVTAKIRHHGKPQSSSSLGYGHDPNFAGVTGVPLRLSATEVEGEDSDDDSPSAAHLASASASDLSGPAARSGNHRRTGSSGRSSTGSGRRGLAYRTSGGAASGSRWSPNGTPERAGSMGEVSIPVPYAPGAGGGGVTRASSGATSTRSGGSSASAAERADNVPDMVAQEPGQARSAAKSLANSASNSKVGADDLRRRGSVDERSMTLSAGRLYIANPD